MRTQKTRDAKRFAVEALPLGRLVITPAASDAVPFFDVMLALRRHKSFDWGEVPDTDAALNDEAVDHEARVLSVYTTETGVTFWVITEWDRSHTTILLPSEY